MAEGWEIYAISETEQDRTEVSINNLCKKNYRFKHACNDDNDIGRRKQQKLDYHIFTCKFRISYITMLRLEIYM